MTEDEVVEMEETVVETVMEVEVLRNDDDVDDDEGDEDGEEFKMVGVAAVDDDDVDELREVRMKAFSEPSREEVQRRSCCLLWLVEGWW